MGFRIFDFTQAAPGVVVVQVLWRDDTSPEREQWLIKKLDDYFARCRDSDLFHLSFMGYLDGLQAAGVVSGYKERIAAPRASFDGYRCAYRDSRAPVVAPEIPAIGSGKKENRAASPDPSPLDALLRPDAWDQKPREPLNSPGEEAEMQYRLDHMFEDVPDGMIAE